MILTQVVWPILISAAMRIALERNGARDERPVYRQIADQIRGEIEAARLEAGARLPADPRRSRASSA